MSVTDPEYSLLHDGGFFVDRPMSKTICPISRSSKGDQILPDSPEVKASDSLLTFDSLEILSVLTIQDWIIEELSELHIANQIGDKSECVDAVLDSLPLLFHYFHMGNLPRDRKWKATDAAIHAASPIWVATRVGKDDFERWNDHQRSRGRGGIDVVRLSLCYRSVCRILSSTHGDFMLSLHLAEFNFPSFDSCQSIAEVLSLSRGVFRSVSKVSRKVKSRGPEFVCVGDMMLRAIQKQAETREFEISKELFHKGELSPYSAFYSHFVQRQSHDDLVDGKYISES